MKKAEDYLKNVNSFTTREELYEIGKQMQIDAIDEAVKLCAKKAYAKFIMVPSAMSGTIYSANIIVDKQSILNCAGILKKEL